jgi:tetratricopeptide (TPR) repeat protein
MKNIDPAKISQAVSRATDLVHRAQSARRAGKSEQARLLYETAITIFEGVGDAAGQALALNSVGLVHYTNGQLEMAFDAFARARECALSCGHDERAAFALGNMGMVQADLGRSTEAAAWHREALGIHRRINNRAGIAVQTGNLGLLALNRGALDEADRYLAETLSTYELLRNFSGVANAKNVMGEVCRARGQYPEARALYTQALKHYAEAGETYGQLQALQNLGNLERMAGDLSKAQHAFSMALSAAKSLGDSRAEAAANTNLGNVALTSGRRNDAVKHYRASREIHESMGLQVGVAGDITNLGNVLAEEGALVDALARYREAHSLYMTIGQAQRALLANVLVGQLLQQLGRVSESRETLERGLAAAEVDGLFQEITLHRATLAGLDLGQGKLRDAEAQLVDVEALFSKAGDQRSRASTLQALAEVYAWQGDFERARRLAQEARAFFISHGFVLSAAGATAILAHVERLAGEFGRAHELCVEACEVFSRHDVPAGMASSYTRMAEIAIEQSEPDVALGFLHRAEPLWHVLSCPRGEADMHCARGETLRLRGDFEGAQAALSTALLHYEELENKIGEAIVLRRQAALARDTGATKTAAKTFRKAGAQFKKLGAVIEAERTQRLAMGC